jgi:hypothetical protein
MHKQILYGVAILVISLGYVSNYYSAAKVKYDNEIIRQKLGIEAKVTWYIQFVVYKSIAIGYNYACSYDLMLFGRQMVNIYQVRT